MHGYKYYTISINANMFNHKRKIHPLSIIAYKLMNINVVKQERLVMYIWSILNLEL